MKTKTRKVEFFTFKVDVTQADIETGECRLMSRCMQKVAIARTLMNEHGAKSDAELRVRVDAGHIRFNLHGYHCLADTPKIAKINLIRFDRGEPVSPHSYVVHARKIAKIATRSRERQDQINAARRARIRAGRPDKIYDRKTLRKRVVGYA
jgi:hypothetical protein